MSHVHVSFETPEYTANVDGLGALRILESIRLLDMGSKVKFYQASTSELFGKCKFSPQNELTPFNPRSPYAIAKLFLFTLLRIIERPTICLQVMVYYLIMNLLLG